MLFRKLCIRTPWPRCLCLMSPVKIILCSTAVECDPTFSFLQLHVFQLLQKRQSDSSDSIRSLNCDNISSIRINDHPKETEGIEMTIDMQLKLCKDLPCGVGFTHCWRLYCNMFLCLIAVFIRWLWVVTSSTFTHYLFFVSPEKQGDT